MKDLNAKLRLKARNELLKWLHKPHEEPELSDFEQGYLEATKITAQLVEALKSAQSQGITHYEDCESLDYDDLPCDCGSEAVELEIRNALEAFNEELES